MTTTTVSQLESGVARYAELNAVRFIPFDLPATAEATAPPEALGRTRDSVRLEVASTRRGIFHTIFHRLDEFIERGDVLVVNNSATLPASIDGVCRGQKVRLHVSVPVPRHRRRLVELRLPEGASSRRCTDGRANDVIDLNDGGRVRLLAPRLNNEARPRLWEASFELPETLLRYLHRWGQPIRYSYIVEPWPLKYYQTIFATLPGSSEMPSAGRPFSKPLVKRLIAKGVKLCAVTLHTGVASLESHEPPYAEPYSVSATAAKTINTARRSGRRIIAVGTTVVRALETVCGPDGLIRPGAGFTDLVITPRRPVRSVQGLITGWHEPQATHLMMLEAIAGIELLTASYTAALGHGYRWHEFGDSHLILP
jgi:S-adenosylmethionine:tRNA ribosyltransferase-isomerase